MAIIEFWRTAAEQLGISRVALTTVSLDVQSDSVCEIGHADLNLASGQDARLKYVVIWRQDEGHWRWHVDIWNSRP